MNIQVVIGRNYDPVFTYEADPAVGVPRIGEHLDVDRAGMLWTSTRRYRVAEVRWQFDVANKLVGLTVQVEEQHD
jgi:hypothetical protein